MDIQICPCCGKEIILEDNEYESIDGKLYCLDCFEEYFDKCEWCREYVPANELAWYGSILCCNDCAANSWIEMENALGWR